MVAVSDTDTGAGTEGTPTIDAFQVLVPDSDVTVAGWYTGSGTTNLSAAIDEEATDLSDYVTTQLPPTMRTEAESMLPATGWVLYTEGATSYAQRTTNADQQVLTYTSPSLPAGSTVKVMGYPGGAPLEYSLDGGAWTGVTAAVSQFTSGALSAGVHTLAVRNQAGFYAYINYFEYVTP